LISLPSTYHDVSLDPVHIADSTTRTLPNTPTVLKPTTVAYCVPPPTRPTPTSHQPSRLHDPQPQAPTGQHAQHSPADFAHHLWMTYLVHEHHNTQQGLPTFTTYGTSALVHFGMHESEMHEYNACRHAFLHVPQTLFPKTRPDGLPGQYFHLTQIPYGIDVDPITGLSRSYQILIRFDSSYNEMRKDNVQEAARA
jgi:hypothetical protein